MSNHLSPIILMYHGVLKDASSVIPYNRETGAEFYDVTVANFKAQMSCLKTQGFNAVVFDGVKAHDPQKTVLITFDDGEVNNYQYAWPVLNDFGWKAYFFIIVKRIGENGYMDWKQLKELQKAGMIVGSHGLTHEVLTNLLDSQMEEELRASKKTLEINLGVPIDTLSIPRGFCNDKVIEAAYRLGYKTVFISDRPAGLKSGCFSRVAVKSNWTVKRFEMALKGKKPLVETIGSFIIKKLKFVLRESGYNWVRGVLIKIAR